MSNRVSKARDYLNHFYSACYPSLSEIYPDFSALLIVVNLILLGTTVLANVCHRIFDSTKPDLPSQEAGDDCGTAYHHEDKLRLTLSVMGPKKEENERWVLRTPHLFNLNIQIWGGGRVYVWSGRIFVTSEKIGGTQWMHRNQLNQSWKVALSWIQESRSVATKQKKYQNSLIGCLVYSSLAELQTIQIYWLKLYYKISLLGSTLHLYSTSPKNAFTCIKLSPSLYIPQTSI